MEMFRVIVFTADVPRLASFYRSCFGLTDIGNSDVGWTELNAGSCNIAFHRISEEGEGQDWVKIVFGSANVEAEKERLEKMGVKMSDVVEFGEIKLCDGQDPDGNWFQISSRGT